MLGNLSPWTSDPSLISTGLVKQTWHTKFRNWGQIWFTGKKVARRTSWDFRDPCLDTKRKQGRLALWGHTSSTGDATWLELCQSHCHLQILDGKAVSVTYFHPSLLLWWCLVQNACHIPARSTSTFLFSFKILTFLRRTDLLNWVYQMLT